MERVTDRQSRIGRVVAISISAHKGTPKTNVSGGAAGCGLGHRARRARGNRASPGKPARHREHRQDAGQGPGRGPGAFAENITTESIAVCPTCGSAIACRIAEAELEITQIGKECHDRCAIFYAAGDCVMPREGIFGRVVTGGDIHVGDTVAVIPAVGTGDGA